MQFGSSFHLHLFSSFHCYIQVRQLMECPVPLSYVFTFAEDDAAAKERDQLRHERHKERERDRRIARAAPEKRYV